MQPLPVLPHFLRKWGRTGRTEGAEGRKQDLGNLEDFRGLRLAQRDKMGKFANPAKFKLYLQHEVSMGSK